MVYLLKMVIFHGYVKYNTIWKSGHGNYVTTIRNRWDWHFHVETLKVCSTSNPFPLLHSTSYEWVHHAPSRPPRPAKTLWTWPWMCSDWASKEAFFGLRSCWSQFFHEHVHPCPSMSIHVHPCLHHNLFMNISWTCSSMYHWSSIVTCMSSPYMTLLPGHKNNRCQIQKASRCRHPVGWLLVQGTLRSCG